MAELISPCCGAEYTDDDKSYCCCAKISETGLCYECHDNAEPSEGYICAECEEFFEEPEKDYEYSERLKDEKAERDGDERRENGL